MRGPVLCTEIIKGALTASPTQLSFRFVKGESPGLCDPRKQLFQHMIASNVVEGVRVHPTTAAKLSIYMVLAWKPGVVEQGCLKSQTQDEEPQNTTFLSSPPCCNGSFSPPLPLQAIPASKAPFQVFSSWPLYTDCL